jgi:hypothetical protein
LVHVQRDGKGAAHATGIDPAVGREEDRFPALRFDGRAELLFRTAKVRQSVDLFW